MFNTLKKRIKNEKGLSLVELLAVIVILAIVAAIAIPAIGNIIENSRVKALKADALTIANAAELYYTDGNTAGFELDTATTGTGSKYVKITSTVDTKITVSKAGVIAGKLSKGGVSITFLANATRDKINAESPDTDTAVTVTKQ